MGAGWEAGGNRHTSQASPCQGQEQRPEVMGRSMHHVEGEVGLCPGHALSGRGLPAATLKPLSHECVPDVARAPAGASAPGRLTSLSKWTTVSLGGRARASLLLSFLFTFNADWSAGKSPCFTLTESPGHRDVASVLASTAPPRSAPGVGQARCAKNSRSPWCPGGPFKSERRGGGRWGSCVCWQHSGCGRGHRWGI